MRGQSCLTLLSLLVVPPPSLTALAGDPALPRFASAWECAGDSVAARRAGHVGRVPDDVGKVVRTACDALVALGRPTTVGLLPDTPIRAAWTYAGAGSPRTTIYFTRQVDGTWAATRFSR